MKDETIYYVDQYCECGEEVPTDKELVGVDKHGEVNKCTSCTQTESV